MMLSIFFFFLPPSKACTTDGWRPGGVCLQGLLINPYLRQFSLYVMMQDFAILSRIRYKMAKYTLDLTVIKIFMVK